MIRLGESLMEWQLAWDILYPLIILGFIIGIVFMVITGAVRLGWMLAPYVFIGALLLWFFNLGG